MSFCHVETQKPYFDINALFYRQVVTWQLENTNNDGLMVAQVREYMTRSLKKWSDAANIDFREIPPTPGGPQAPASQIRVQFGQGNHGDQFPFDGPSGTLAHAFFPLNNVGKCCCVLKKVVSFNQTLMVSSHDISFSSSDKRELIPYLMLKGLIS